MYLNNIIDARIHLICPILHNALTTGKLPNQTEKLLRDKPGVYFVMFRVLNNNGFNVLLYNYLYSHNLLESALIFYLIGIYREYKEFPRVYTNKLKVIEDIFDFLKKHKYTLNEKNPYYAAIESCYNIDELYDYLFKIIFIANKDEKSNLLLSGYTQDYASFYTQYLRIHRIKF